MDIALLKKDVVPQLWAQYAKSSEYKAGLTKAIPIHYPIVEKREKEGLKMIYSNFVTSLRSGGNLASRYKSRSIPEWLAEWKNMHKTLFKYIYKECGDWRRIDVRFGNFGDEDLHRIPMWQNVPQMFHKR